ncbi:MAG: HAD family hydrolase [Chrysiogenales bacterium]|nr:MAG: HAD family hydrolase [Chrysiogenales bacterium]
MKKIRAITFDLWDTVIIDDSDEPKRAAAGRPPKREERRILAHQYISRHGSIDRKLVDLAWDTADTAFNKVWKELHITWTVQDRIGVALKGLGCTLPDIEFAELVRLHEEMELEIRPDMIPGVKEALEELHGNYRLGIISDAIFSPGRALRQMLSDAGMIRFFDAFIFSDELGRSKPDSSVFIAAAESLGVKPGEMAHIGDREQNDIDGPHRVGARSILCTAAVDRGDGSTAADGTFNDYRDLPDLIAKLNK